MTDIKHVSSLLVLVLSCFFNAVSPTNLCSTNGICCKHRDSHCVAQRINANHTVDTSELPCYCDHACVHLEDCCADYKQFCGGRGNKYFQVCLITPILCGGTCPAHMVTPNVGRFIPALE